MNSPNIKKIIIVEEDEEDECLPYLPCIFGIFTFCFMTLLYLIKSAFISYIESSFEVKYQQLIYSNTFYITISSLLSLVFIFALFYIEKDNLASTYSLIYQRVFIIKTVFDLWLMVNFIYQLFKRDSENYFENFYKNI